MPISLCMIVKDEEKLLVDFLEHHKGLFDELIIIVDSGSKDKTTEIARKFTDKVFVYKWQDDFSAARNFSISKATKDWIIWLDPDERIDKRDFEKIRRLSEDGGKEVRGYSFIQKTYTNVTDHPRFVKENNGEFSGYFIRRICKMFRKDDRIKFEYPVHETVMNSIKSIHGEIKNTDIVIEHYPENKGKDSMIKKEEYYLRLLEKKKKIIENKNVEKELKSEKRILEYFRK